MKFKRSCHLIVPNNVKKKVDLGWGDLKKEKSEQDNKTQVEKRKSKRKPHATPPDASE